jgi:hypothetical protein
LARRPFVTELVGACSAARAAQIVTPLGVRHDLTEDAFLRAAVALEGFLTEWVVRCVSMDTTALRTTLEQKASNYLQGEVPRWRTLPAEFPVTVTAVAIPIPRQMSQTQVRQLLNCEDENISFRGVSDLRVRAMESISDVRGTYVSKLTTAQAKVLDATIAVRNFLAHRSERARVALNDALQTSGLPVRLRLSQNLGAESVGRYLCAKPTVAGPRFELFLETLGDVALKLAPFPGKPLKICP